MTIEYTKPLKWVGGVEIKAYIEGWQDQAKYVDLPEEKMFVGDLSFSLRNIEDSLKLGFKEAHVLPKKLQSSINEYVYLDILGVESEFTGYGIGKNLMVRFIQHCTEYYPNNPILLRASPFREETLNLRKLTQFYEYFDFIVYKKGEKSNFMIRL